ncbi:hypothetical protein C0J52_23098 [Blattella germanica]|nr:hypothetical protein C0J52_23098 [Blattella germanica]
MALLYILVACFAANALAKKCNFGDSQIDFLDIDQFAGQWYSLYEQPELVKTRSHFKNIFQATDAKNTDGIIYSKAISSDGKEISYSGTVSINDDGSMDYKTKDLNDYSGPYKVVDTDYDCYAIIRGCPKKGPAKTLTWVQFRSTRPTAECERAALEGMKSVGIDSTKLVRQTYK